MDISPDYPEKHVKILPYMIIILKSFQAVKHKYGQQQT